VELREIPTLVAIATHLGWEIHDAKLTGLSDAGATTEVHFDLPDRCVENALILEVNLDGESIVAMCEHLPPERTEPGTLYLQFTNPDVVHIGPLGELIDRQP
jgi:hypothetical protein